MSTQTSQLCGFMDPAYYQHQQQQQNFQVSPQQIQHLRHLQQQAALHHQQAGYPQQSQQHAMAMPQYHPHPQQQQQHHHPVPTYEQTTTLDSSEQPSSPEEKTQNKAARRAEHNAIERARREHLNTKFQQLAHSLPNLQNDRRPSKGTIIERTLEFVKHTVQKEERYKNEIKELSRANRHLMRQVTSRSSLLAGGSISSVGDEEEEENDDDGFDVLDYDVEDSMDAITTTDDTLSRKSSCSSFAVHSMSSMPTTTVGGSSATTSPSLDYHPPSMMNHQWGDHAVPTAQQPSYHHHYQDPDMYLQDHGYLLTTASLDPAKQPMAMMNNNMHIKYESSFRC